MGKQIDSELVNYWILIQWPFLFIKEHLHNVHVHNTGYAYDIFDTLDIF